MAKKDDMKIAQKSSKERTADNVSDWLGTIGLGSSEVIFRQLGIVGDVFPQLIDPINTNEIESGLKLDLSQRLKIRSAVAKLVKEEADKGEAPASTGCARATRHDSRRNV